MNTTTHALTHNPALTYIIDRREAAIDRALPAIDAERAALGLRDTTGFYAAASACARWAVDPLNDADIARTVAEVAYEIWGQSTPDPRMDALRAILLGAAKRLDPHVLRKIEADGVPADTTTRADRASA